MKFNDTDIAIKKKEIKFIYTSIYLTSIIITSIVKTSLSIILILFILIKIASPISPLLLYRVVSFSLLIYEITISKTYLITDDLYIKYAPLKYVKSIKSISYITRTTIILPIIIIHDLYKRFEKLIIFIIKWIPKSLVKRIINRSIN